MTPPSSDGTLPLVGDSVDSTATARADAEAGGDVFPMGTRFRPWGILRTIPAAIWVITLLFTALLAGWSVMMPQYHAPDEPNHVDAVMRLVEGKGWPHPGHAIVTQGGVGAIMAAPYGSEERPRDLSAGPFTAADAVPRHDRPSWEELDRTPAPEGSIQQLVQHPPLYYWVDAMILKAVPGGGDHLRWDEIIGILRLISVAMVAPLPLLAWAGANRLSGGSRVAGICAALVPLGIPQLTHIGSSVNNDNLLVLTSGLATVSIVYVLRGDTSLRTATWTGVFVGLALMTKSLAITLVPMAALAYLVAWGRARRDARAAWARGPAVAVAVTGPAAIAPYPATPYPAGPRTTAPRTTGPHPTGTEPFLLAEAGPAGPPASALRVPWRQLLLGGALAIALGGWWWIVNIVRYGTFQPETPGFPLGQYLGDDWGAYTELLINGTILRWWGSFGWFEVNLTTVPVRTGTAVVIVFFALALIRARTGRIRVDLLFLLWPTWALFGLMTLQSAKNFDRYFHVSGISGRYLYAGLASLAIGVGMGAAATGRYLSRIMPLLFLAGATTLQAWAISMVFPHFWRPTGGDLSDAWDAMVAWAPWPQGALTWLAGAVCVLAVAALACCIGVLVTGGPATRSAGEAPAQPPSSSRGRSPSTGQRPAPPLAPYPSHLPPKRPRTAGAPDATTGSKAVTGSGPAAGTSPEPTGQGPSAAGHPRSP